MYVRSRYVHVYRRGNRSFFFNSLTLELLEGDDDDYRVWESYAEPRAGSDHETVRTLISQRFLVPAGEDSAGSGAQAPKGSSGAQPVRTGKGGSGSSGSR